MVALVLDHAGMEALSLPLEMLSVETICPVANGAVTGHAAHQARNGQTALPAKLGFVANRLDLRIDQHRQGDRIGVFAVLATAALGAYRKNHQPQGNMNLGGGEAGPRRILHRLQHIGDQAANLGCLRVRHLVGTAAQHRVPHLGNFQNGHGNDYGAGLRRGKRQDEINPVLLSMPGAEKRLHKAGRLVYSTLTSKTASRRRLRLSIVIRIGGNGGCAGSSS